MCTVSQADGMAIGAEVGMGWESAVTHWVDNRGSIRDSADERILVKALPGSAFFRVNPRALLWVFG